MNYNMAPNVLIFLVLFANFRGIRKLGNTNWFMLKC